MKHLLLLLLVGGCATTPAPYWEKTHEPLTNERIITLNYAPWPDINGWVYRDYANDTCIIFIRTRAPYEETLEHERKHCAGYSHPDVRRVSLGVL